MTAPRFRSRTFRRIYTRIPSSKVVIHYKTRKPSNHKCGSCRIVLKGVKSNISKTIKKLTKSKKTVKRMFGGSLCSKCSRREIISRTRKNG
ncbi:50S ribosomal protein L34e [archaeon]|nr:50S ribosomal protein L34e [archaeon]|tara:strand:+ start:7214 stop:7486 length:273 start_codon:yes stop_codon:yes gene_type:complete